ncbi:MAG TPA: prepilin peptidase [Myxococcaceae bacterium]|nr:prepilin peptidase [Myxococcaceae bacterium]
MPSSPSLHAWLAAWLFVLGLAVGSFLNVIIARVPRDQSIVRPRSRCPKCGHELAWFENVPIISWLALRGRCRSCRAPISPRYLFVELLTGLLFVGCLQRFGWTYELVPALALVTLLIPLTFIDLEHWLLPFSLTLPGIALGLVLSIPLGGERFIESAIGAAVGFGAFWLLELVGEKVFKKEALGGGDKYLLAMIGAFLSYRPLLGVIFLSSIQGAVVGVALLALRGRAGPAPEPQGPKSEKDLAAVKNADDEWQPGPTNIPFGPWLSLAALEILLLGPWLGHVLPPTIGWIVSGRLVLE